jgi:hypothetical protein
MRKQQTFILAVFLILAVACFDDKDQKVIASVYGNDLLLSEIMKEMPKATEDSSFFVERYINLWIRKQLMIYHAEINLSNDLLDYEQQIKEYRSSLLIYAYQQELINQNFDTTISPHDIMDYYTQHHEEFKLVKNIFKGRYIIVDKLAPKLSSLSRWFKSEDIELVEALTDYCRQFSKEYYLEGGSWQYFSIITDKLPELISEEEYFLKNTNGAWFEDHQYRYYVYIQDYKIKGEISPLALERERIQNILLNKKKIQYLKQLEDELHQNALALGKIKIY